MKKKAIIIDLDNTIYLVSSIGDKLFKTLFQIIEESGDYEGDLSQIKSEIMRIPFQKVASEHFFSQVLETKCLDLLSNLIYNDAIKTFDDYLFLRELPLKKHLVTTGFTKLQHSKIKQLGIENDFESVFVIDPYVSDFTKKDIFQKILIDNTYNIHDVLVIGDDLNSEIKAGNELGLETVLFNFKNENLVIKNQKSISNFKELEQFIRC